MRGWLSALLAGLLLAVYTGRVHAAVTLVSFTASAQVDFILIEWETATELNNAGFYIQRSTQSGTGYARITDLIPSLSDGLTGAQYQYEDHTANAGITYYYKLEAINLNGGSELYGPVSQSWGGNATQTATLTQNATSTSTATSQTTANTSTPTPTGTAGPTSTATSTATLAPTSTATSVAQIATHTPTPSPTPTSPGPLVTLEGTVFPSPTTTLLPLPSITLIFPVLTATQTPTATQIETPAASATPTDTPELDDEPVPTRWKIAAMLLVVLWILLAGFLTILIRRMSLP